MPRKPSTVVPMQSYPAFSSRRWYQVSIESVSRPGKTMIRIVLSILNDPRQAGRKVTHDIPALLAPGSPLHEFLVGGFGIRPAANEQVDLLTLLGRVADARFMPVRDGGEPQIAAFRVRNNGVKRLKLATTRTDETENGLGQGH